jgi:hypothetical protein
MERRSTLLIEAVTIVRVRFPDGTLCRLEPGSPVDFPETQARKVLERANGRVRPVNARSLPGDWAAEPRSTNLRKKQKKSSPRFCSHRGAGELSPRLFRNRAGRHPRACTRQPRGPRGQSGSYPFILGLRRMAKQLLLGP